MVKLFSGIIAISSADQKLVLARMEKMNGKLLQKIGATGQSFMDVLILSFCKSAAKSKPKPAMIYVDADTVLRNFSAQL